MRSCERSNPDTQFSRSGRKRVLVGAFVVLALAWSGLELLRYWAERRPIPVFVARDGPPPGFAARLTGIDTSHFHHWVPYEQVANPRLSTNEIAALKRALARERFLPLFPLNIEIDDTEVVSRYETKVNRRTNRIRETVVVFTKKNDSWHIAAIEQQSGTAHPIRPWKWWEKLLSYLPFVD